VHEAERGRSVGVTRRGKRAALLISEAVYRRWQSGAERSLAAAIQGWRARYGGVELTDAQSTAGCVFQAMPGHDSGASRAGIPRHAGPPFRGMPGR
jgi:hypothetical protein